MMDSKVLSLVVGLVFLTSMGAYYMSSPQKSFRDFDISDLEKYSHMDPDELHYRINLFREWANEYNKQYSTIEATARFYAWNQNYDFVQDHNSKNLSWTVEMNKFADLSSEEFGALYTGLNAQGYEPDESNQNLDDIVETQIESNEESDLEESLDWRTKGAVSKMKDQGSCGGCYAFAAAAGMEGAYVLSAKKKLVAFSPQQIIDCSNSYGNNGCNGGLMTYSYKYIQAAGGLQRETEYPYQTKQNTCKFVKSKSYATVTSYKEVSTYSGLLAATKITTVPVGVQADQSAFQLYKTGVISSGCGTNLNHAITVIGYNGTSYWIVKNQWGTTWGEKGYVKIAMGTQNGGKGVCGINYMASYPLIKALKENDDE